MYLITSATDRQARTNACRQANTLHVEHVRLELEWGSRNLATTNFSTHLYEKGKETPIKVRRRETQHSDPGVPQRTEPNRTEPAKLLNNTEQIT